jgi:hypothetical protein
MNGNGKVVQVLCTVVKITAYSWLMQFLIGYARWEVILIDLRCITQCKTCWRLGKIIWRTDTYFMVTSPFKNEAKRK